MNLQLFIRSLFLVAGVLGVMSTFAQDSPPDSAKAREIVALVEKATSRAAVDHFHPPMKQSSLSTVRAMAD